MSEYHGKIWWNELNTDDPEAAKAFYETVMGWTVETVPMPTGDYLICKRGEEAVAGIFSIKDLEGFEGIPSHWFTYLAVDDVDASVVQSQSAGGKLTRPAWDIPGVGRMAVIQDPTGAYVALMTPSEEMMQG